MLIMKFSTSLSEQMNRKKLNKKFRKPIEELRINFIKDVSLIKFSLIFRLRQKLTKTPKDGESELI
jgi:hypothetical protein